MRERFLAELRDRLAKFSLELAIREDAADRVRRFAAERRAARGLGKPETFEFLGFTHICAKTRHGAVQAQADHDKKRLRAKLHKVKAELRATPCISPIPEQGLWLASVVRGHYNYYAVPDNIEALQRVPRAGDPTLVPGASAPQPAQTA